MENASKALIIAGGILLAIMVLSIGVLMANSGGMFSQSYSDRIEQDNINAFNQKILYYARDINAQDMVSLINFVKETNEKYSGLTDREIVLKWNTGKKIDEDWEDEDTMIEKMSNTVTGDDAAFKFQSVSYYDSGYIKEIIFKK